MQKRHLRMVTDANNNKDYLMEDNQDGTFTVQWGRYGASMQSTTYPIALWDKKLNEKVNKGYRDISTGKPKYPIASYQCTLGQYTRIYDHVTRNQAKYRFAKEYYLMFDYPGSPRSQKKDVYTKCKAIKCV